MFVKYNEFKKEVRGAEPASGAALRTRLQQGVGGPCQGQLPGSSPPWGSKASAA